MATNNNNNNNSSSSCPEIYILASGEKVCARTPHDLIEHLRHGHGSSSFGSFDNSSESIEQYMFRFSERCLFSLKRIVRFDTAENFVADLKKVGVIERILSAN